MKNLTFHQLTIIDRHGFELTQTGYLDFINAGKAKSTDLHHTFEPIAAAGWSRLAPTIATLRLPHYELGQLVVKRPAMSCDTAEVFAIACGLNVSGPFVNRPQQFYEHLCAVLDKYELGAFFGHYPGEGEYHGAIRPRGCDWANGSSATVPNDLKHFRAAYRRLPDCRKMLVATILWLYRGSRNDEPWLTGLPRSWNAVHAILELQSGEMLEDWGELVARYPGW